MSFGTTISCPCDSGTVLPGLLLSSPNATVAVALGTVYRLLAQPSGTSKHKFTNQIDRDRERTTMCICYSVANSQEQGNQQLKIVNVNVIPMQRVLWTSEVC